MRTSQVCFTFSSELGLTARHNPRCSQQPLERRSKTPHSLPAQKGISRHQRVRELARTDHPAEIPHQQAGPKKKEVALRPSHLGPVPRLARIPSTAGLGSACGKQTRRALGSSAAVAPARTARASLLEEEEKGRENRVTRWRICSSYGGGGGGRASSGGQREGRGVCAGVK